MLDRKFSIDDRERRLKVGQLPLGQPPLGSQAPAPELWRLYNARKAKGESIGVFPMVRRMLPEGDFIEIHVDTPLEEAERRDATGSQRDRAGHKCRLRPGNR